MIHLRQRLLFSLTALLLLPFFSLAQTRNVGSFVVDETELYAMTKQMSQFFSRFNQEEDQFGKKIHPSSPDYRNNEKRRAVLPLLFDAENPRTGGTLRDLFIEDLTRPSDTNFMEFLGGRWYAETEASFDFQGKPITVIMILTIEKEGYGSKWVITNVYIPSFSKLFPEGEMAEREKHFLHPMSHELDFMNIHKAFRQSDLIDYYADKSYRPDYLSIFFYEVKLGRMKFKQINNLKFHIFQLTNWYFEVSYFNRPGMNSGWLISNLMYVKEADKAALLQFYQPRGL